MHLDIMTLVTTSQIEHYHYKYYDMNTIPSNTDNYIYKTLKIINIFGIVSLNIYLNYEQVVIFAIFN